MLFSKSENGGYDNLIINTFLTRPLPSKYKYIYYSNIFITVGIQFRFGGMALFWSTPADHAASVEKAGRPAAKTLVTDVTVVM